MIIFDLFIGFIYAFLFLFLGIMYANRTFVTTPYLRKPFIYSLGFKLLSALLFGCVYQFYYKYGDTITYYIWGQKYFHYVLEHPGSFFDFTFLDYDILESKYPDFQLESEIPVFSSIMVQRIVMYLSPFALSFYFPLCLFFSLVSFAGCWKISRTLSKLYPSAEKYFMISFLYIPSVVFWTAGIGKDAISIGFLNLAASLILEALILRNHLFRNLLFSIFFLYVVLMIKSYLVISFLPFFIFFITSYKIKLIKNRGRRFALNSFIFLFLFSSVLFVLFMFKDQIKKNLVDETLTNAFMFTQGQISNREVNDSSYDLGISSSDIEANNIVPYVVPSIIVALFRPFGWEVHKPIILFSFLESFLLLIFTVYVFVKGYFFKTMRLIIRHEFVLFAILFSLLLAFFIGLVSANFGTLVRYKTPFLSYLLAALFILYQKLNSRTENNLSGTDSESILYDTKPI